MTCEVMVLARRDLRRGRGVVQIRKGPVPSGGPALPLSDRVSGSQFGAYLETS